MKSQTGTLSTERQEQYDKIYKDACKDFMLTLRNNGFTCSYFSIDVKGVRDLPLHKVI